MINFILWLIFGGVTGWLASLTMRTDTQGPLIYILYGIIGAYLGGFISMTLGFGALNANVFNLTSLIISFIGTVVFLSIVNLFTRGRLRGGQPRKTQTPARSLADAQGRASNPVSSPAKERVTQIAPEVRQPLQQQSAPQTQARPVNPATAAPSAKEAPHRMDQAPSKNAQAIFISYRRDDAADIAGRIYDRLAQHFSRNIVFKDVDSIPLGVDFRKHLLSTIEQCTILLAVIGRQWLTATDSSGRRRLHNPDDFVRIEIEGALQRDILVVPLLVQGTSMPSLDELPDSLSGLVYRNAATIRSDPDFHRDMDRLIQAIENLLQSQSGRS